MVRDGCGVAPGIRPGEFLANSGLGGVVVIDARMRTIRPLAVGGPEAARWNNHLVAAPASRLSPDIVCNPDDGGEASLHVFVGGGP